MRMESGKLILTDGLRYDELSVSTVAVGLSNAPGTMRRAVLQLSGSAIRWIAAPAQTPTSAVGMVMNDGDILVYDGEPSQILFIQDASATGASTLRVHYFGA